MANHNQLTDLAVRSKKKPGYYLDGRGLYLQVAPSGGRSWLLRYTLRGRTREMGLGSLLDFGLARARERAQQARALLTDGIDPIDHRAAALAERTAQEATVKQSSVTFETCARSFTWRTPRTGKTPSTRLSGSTR